MDYGVLLAAASGIRAGSVVPGLPDPVLGALIGAAVAQLGAFAILYATLRTQAVRAREEREFRERQEQSADRRAFRDEKRERLRRAYATVITASLGMGQAVRESTRLFTTASGGSLNDRVAGILKEAFVDINTARVELMLDSAGKEVLDAFHDVVVDAFNDFNQGWAARAESPGSVTAGELAAHRERLQEGIETLVRSARTHLARLEQVIPPATPSA
jgi:hypothetical protein